MNREIKFRAWDTDNNVFVNCEDHQIRQIGNNYGGLGNRFVYMQFTGLKDKNGKEIYEGDILKSIHFVDTKGKEYYLYHKILWSEKYKGWQSVFINQDGSEDNGNPQLFVYIKHTIFEVIGNVYENPELKTGL